MVHHARSRSPLVREDVLCVFRRRPRVVIGRYIRLESCELLCAPVVRASCYWTVDKAGPAVSLQIRQNGWVLLWDRNVSLLGSQKKK